jgi:pyridoxal 5'-phosphate synthase pdxS subunit
MTTTGESTRKSFRQKVALAWTLKGGVIMDVTTADQARIAAEAGACAVMALERVPADIRAQGGVARMAKCRIGHFVEARCFRPWAWTTSTKARS